MTPEEVAREKRVVKRKDSHHVNHLPVPWRGALDRYTISAAIPDIINVRVGTDETVLNDHKSRNSAL